ncbi:UNVERIFIED_CONTAM: hypothetical protein NCL1_28321 [Trichonephila clavipes]
MYQYCTFYTLSFTLILLERSKASLTKRFVTMAICPLFDNDIVFLALINSCYSSSELLQVSDFIFVESFVKYPGVYNSHIQRKYKKRTVTLFPTNFNGMKSNQLIVGIQITHMFVINPRHADLQFHCPQSHLTNNHVHRYLNDKQLEQCFSNFQYLRPNTQS